MHDFSLNFTRTIQPKAGTLFVCVSDIKGAYI